MRRVTSIAPMTRAAWSALIFLSTIWGGSFFFVEVAVAELPPLSIVLLRVGIAAVALNIWLALRGQALPRDWAAWRSFLLMGLLNNLVPFVLIVWGQTRISGSLASILNATTPMFTVMVAHFWTRDERLNLAKFVGVTIGIGGVIVLVGSDTLAGLTDNAAAQLACLGGALSYAVAAVFGRRFARLGMAPAATATGQLTASTLLLLPVALAVDRPWHLALPSIVVWFAVVGLALVSTALAYILYFRVLARFGATNLLLVTLLIPVSATALGVAFLGEQLAVQHVAGMVAIAMGLVVIDGRLWPAIHRVFQ